ncbi:MAG: LPS assembly lipoprotein LptE [Rhodothalassiaceae bacterium]
MMRILVALLFCLLLGGCGFSPLYAPAGTGAAAAGSDVPKALATVEVASARDRVGQELRNHLIAMLTPRGYPAAARYRLEFDLDEQVEGFAFRSDRAVTRERLRLHARYRLRDLATDSWVIEAETDAASSYDVVQSDFANISAQRDARSRASAMLAQRIAAHLARHFRQAAGKAVDNGQGRR